MQPWTVNVPEPVVGKADAVSAERRGHAGTTVMPDDDDMLDAQQVDGELNDRQTIEVGVHDHVADVAVNEDLPRWQVDDLVRRHATVRAADPQVLGRLLVRETDEEFGVVRMHALRPLAVAVQQVGERAQRSPPRIRPSR